MKKQLLPAFFALLLGLCMPFMSKAQLVNISGKVTGQSGDPLPGVNVMIKGSSSGTTTDAQGAYILNTSASGSAIIFSAIGFVSQEKTIGKQSVINVVLLEDTKILNEVVVTALGIKREEKSLGFAASTINENAVKDAKSNNWVNTLSGKVAGVQVSGSGGGFASSNVTIRGFSSITRSNQPLYVIDGVPVDNGGDLDGLGSGTLTVESRRRWGHAIHQGKMAAG